MRTTLSLDDDVAINIQKLRVERGASLKEVVNEVLRAGLVVLEKEDKKPSGTYRIQPVSGGVHRLPDLDNITELLVAGESESFL
ncbi:MAG: DUF2191 domain-containing protein [Myxococcota bacterium]